MVKTRRNVGSLIPPVDDPEHLGANINRAIAESQSLASSGAPQAPTLSATGQESHCKFVQIGSNGCVTLSDSYS